MGKFTTLFEKEAPVAEKGRFSDLFTKIKAPAPKFTGMSFLPHNVLKTGVEEGIKGLPELAKEGIIKPVKTFAGGFQKGAANLADTLDFYSDKITKAIGKPELKPKIFEYLKNEWGNVGEQLQTEGVSNKFIKSLYSGLGQASFDVPVLMAGGKVLKAATLPVAGAVEGGKQGGWQGAATGTTAGALMHGTIKGLNVLPTKIKLPTAFGVGAAVTPGKPEEKVAGGAVFTGLSMGGKSPTMKEFKETIKISPITKGFEKLFPAEKREGLYQSFVNRMQSIENIVDKAKALGADIKPGENPALRARGYLGVGAKVKTVLEDKTYKTNPDGTFTYTGEGLKPILDNYDKITPEKNPAIRDKDLNDYLIAQRTIKDLQRPKSEFSQENIVTPEQVKKAQDTLNKLSEKYGVIQTKPPSPTEGKVLSKLPISNQKLAYSKFIEQGNKDTFEGFVKQFGNSQFDTKGEPIEVGWSQPKLSTPTGEGHKQFIPAIKTAESIINEYPDMDIKVFGSTQEFKRASLKDREGRSLLGITKNKPDLDVVINDKKIENFIKNNESQIDFSYHDTKQYIKTMFPEGYDKLINIEGDTIFKAGDKFYKWTTVGLQWIDNPKLVKSLEQASPIKQIVSDFYKLSPVEEGLAPRTYYHATTKENADLIRKEGIKQGMVSDTKSDAEEYAQMLRNRGNKDVEVMELKIPQAQLKSKGIVETVSGKRVGARFDVIGEGQKTTIISHLDQTATRLYDYQKRVLSTLVDSGNLSQEQYNAILIKNPNYVPFDRVIEGVDTAGTPVSKNRFTGARSPIKRIKGSELEIHNPIESMIKNTYRIMDIAERNTVARGVANLSKVLPEDISPVKVTMRPVNITEQEAGGEAKTIFRPSQFKPKGNVIEYFDNGKRSYIEVTPNLYQAMTGLNETSLGLLAKILQWPARTLRIGATITPEFMLRNPIRDQWTAFMQTKLGFKPFVDTTGAIADIMGKSEVYNDWLRSGGAYSGFVELSRPKLQTMLKDLQGKPNLLKNLNIISKAQDISQLFEQATRLAVYKAGVKKGLSPVEAGFESRESTLDFARRGAKTKDLNAITAFFNAGIQATDKLIRTAQNDPAGFAAKGIATITIPSIIAYALNRDNPEYKELPRWQKDLFWMFKVKDTWVRIPKPFAYGQIFGSLPERFFEYLDTQDPKAFSNLTKNIYDSLSPVSGDPMSGMLPTGIKPLIENATNWSFFGQRPIVSKGKENLLPEKQYGRYTTETAKKIGELINYSPAKIENLIRGWFGGSGAYALQTLDLLGKGVAKFTGKAIATKRPTELSDIPLVKGFVAAPAGSQAQSVNEFYQNRDRINKAYTTIQKYQKEGNQAKATKIQLKYPNYRFYEGFNKTSQTLSDLANFADSIINSNKPDKEKRELLRKIDKQKIEIAQKANQFIK